MAQIIVHNSEKWKMGRGPGTHNKCKVVLHIHISNTAEMRAPPTHTETDRGSAPTDHRVSEATHTLNRAFAMSSHATLCMYDLYVLKVCTSLDTESRLDAPVSALPSMGKDHQFASTVIPLTKDSPARWKEPTNLHPHTMWVRHSLCTLQRWKRADMKAPVNNMWSIQQDGGKKRGKIHREPRQVPRTLNKVSEPYREGEKEEETMGWAPVPILLSYNIKRERQREVNGPTLEMQPLT